MTLPAILKDRLSLPAIAAPMFILSNPELVMAQCRAGVVGAFPSLNARGNGKFEEWLTLLEGELTEKDAPFAVNLIVHRSNTRLEEDLTLCVKHRVPIIISSLGAREDVNEAIHSYGGTVLHDITNNFYAKKAIAKGADGLIAVAAGAGGHAGTLSPFALVQEIREWFDGPVALSGSIARGEAIAAAIAMGADLAYMGSAFIATHEANADDAYKQMVADCYADDIVYTNLFTGVHGNYLKPSIKAAGMDPDNLPSSDPTKMDFGSTAGDAKAWKDIWGCGQGIGAIKEVTSAAERIAVLKAGYKRAINALSTS